MIALLRDFVAGLQPRYRRALVFVCAAVIALYARATVAAVQRGDGPEILAGAILLGGLAVVAAAAWSSPRPRTRRRGF